jgi:tetratricopeptide (TPR) repeat protein
MKKIIVAVAMTVGLCASAFAEVGETGATFLKLGIGARESAMGGAVVASGLEANALFWNPAGMAGIRYPQIAFCHSEHLLGTRYEAIAGARNVGKIGSIGAGVAGFFVGNVEKRTGPSDDPQSSFGGYNFCFNAGYAKALSSALSSGLNTKIIYERMDEYTATAFAVDAGTSYQTGLKGLRLGAALQNVGTKAKFKYEPYSLPASFKAGFCIPVKEDALSVAAELAKPFSEPAEFRFGGELKLGSAMRLRAGYRTGYSSLGGIAGLVAGIGFDMNYVNIDYAVDPYGTLGVSHKISLSYSFGKSERLKQEKEKLIADEFSKRARVTAESFHNSALSYYSAGQLNEAIQAWDMALVWDPTYVEAQTMLQKAREEQKKLAVTAHLDAGNKYMDAGNFVDALAEFNTVLDLDPENSLAKRMFETASSFIGKLELEKGRKGSFSANEVATHYNKAASLYAQKRYSQAIAEWQKVVALDPGHKDALNYIGKARKKMEQETDDLLKSGSDLMAQKRWEAAYKDIHAVLVMNPTDATAIQKEAELKSGLKEASRGHLQAGIGLINEGKFAQAEGELRMALNLDPDNASAKTYLNKIKSSKKPVDREEVADLYLKGIGAYTRDDLETAVFYWRKVLELDPGHENARKNLQRAEAKLSHLNGK